VISDGRGRKRWGIVNVDREGRSKFRSVFMAGLEGVAAVNARLEGTWREARFFREITDHTGDVPDQDGCNIWGARLDELVLWKQVGDRLRLCIFESLVVYVVGGSALVLDESNQLKAERRLSDFCPAFAF
jgi:hypothetical protein